MKNKPYIKTVDENGKCDDKFPILHSFANREKRRHKEPPLFGNGKNIPLTVTKTAKYLRHIQMVFNEKQERIVRIPHYILK